MINVIAISSNPEFRLHFSRKFNRKIKNIKFVGFRNDVDEFSNKYHYRQKPNIIISTNSDDQKLKEKLKLLYIHIPLYEEGTYPISLLNEQLKRISLNTVYTQKIIASTTYMSELHILINLKFNPYLSGTIFLLDCILALKQNPYSRVTYKFIKNHTKYISYKYCIPIRNIIDDMRESIEEMHNHTSSTFRKKIYGTNAYIDYPEIVKSIYLL